MKIKTFFTEKLPMALNSMLVAVKNGYRHFDKIAEREGRSRKNFCETEIRKVITERVLAVRQNKLHITHRRLEKFYFFSEQFIQRKQLNY